MQRNACIINQSIDFTNLQFRIIEKPIERSNIGNVKHQKLTSDLVCRLF